MKEVLEEHLEKRAPISGRQWGFYGGSLHNVCSHPGSWWPGQCTWPWVQSLCVIFFDVRKAFDSVPHLPLLDQLQAFNVHPYLQKWVSNYLFDRFNNLLLLRVRLQIDYQRCLAWTISNQNNMMSPPPLPPKGFMYRPRANSLPPTILCTPAFSTGTPGTDHLPINLYFASSVWDPSHRLQIDAQESV